MHFVLRFWHIPQTRGIMPMMVLKYHVQKLMHVAIVIKSCLDSGERADHTSLLEEPKQHNP